jgi:hypothetical protein
MSAQADINESGLLELNSCVGVDVGVGVGGGRGWSKIYGRAASAPLRSNIYKCPQIAEKSTVIIVWNFVTCRRWEHSLRRTATCNICLGRSIAQAVSRRLPTAAARVQTLVWSFGNLWWTKVALVQVFFENFGFPCQSTFRLLLHNHLHYHPTLAQ